MDYVILYVCMSVYFLFSCVFISAANVQKNVLLEKAYRFLGMIMRCLSYASIIIFLFSPWYGDVELEAKCELWILAVSITVAVVSWIISKVTKWRFI